MTDPTRRLILLERMNFLESDGMGCLGCSGTCCTYEANSMLVSPLEAIELFEFLKKELMLTPDLHHKLTSSIEKYRLLPKYVNERSYLRKTYTCPFFHHKEFGCPLPREVKPYGCLAFDSHHKELKASEHCYSEIELLEKREALHPEEKEINEKLRRSLDLMWEKAPIPNALLEIWDKLTSADPIRG
jgi:hypothetical protein